MRNPVFRFRRHIAAHVTKGYQLQIGAKALLVKSHGFTAVSVKNQICVDFFHDPLHFLFLVAMNGEWILWFATLTQPGSKHPQPWIGKCVRVVRASFVIPSRSTCRISPRRALWLWRLLRRDFWAAQWSQANGAAGWRWPRFRQSLSGTPPHWPWTAC